MSASREIDQNLSRVANLNSRTISMLLLGIGGCGKSTILKQLEMIYGPNGISDEKLRDTISRVHLCILEDIHNVCSQNIVLLSNRKHPECKLQQKNELLCCKIANQSKHSFLLNSKFKISEKFGQEIEQLWNDSGMKNTFIISQKSSVMDNTAYFFDEILRISSTDYKISTIADYVKARIRTAGIIEFVFPLNESIFDTAENESLDDDQKYISDDENDGQSVSKNVNQSVKRFGSLTRTKKPKNTHVLENSVGRNSAIQKWNLKITDVGGQRVERRKWVNCFTEVDVLLYVVSLADYNKVLWEDQMSNCMQEAFDVFEKLMNEKALRNVDVIVLLNKQDLFQEKINDIPFELFKSHPKPHSNNSLSYGSTNDSLEFLTLVPLLVNNNKNAKISAVISSSLSTLLDVEKYVIKQLKKRFHACTYGKSADEQQLNQRQFLPYYITCAVDNKNIQNVFQQIVYQTAKSKRAKANNIL